MSTLHHTSGLQRSFQDTLCRQPAAQLTPVPHTNQTYAGASCICQWQHSTFSNLDVCAQVRNCYCCCHCCFSLLLQPTPLLRVTHTAPNMQNYMLKMIEPVELLFSIAADSSSLQHAAAADVPSMYTVCVVALPCKKQHWPPICVCRFAHNWLVQAAAPWRDLSTSCKLQHAHWLLQAAASQCVHSKHHKRQRHSMTNRILQAPAPQQAPREYCKLRCLSMTQVHTASCSMQTGCCKLLHHSISPVTIASCSNVVSQANPASCSITA